jgi:flagellin-like hook-associated protein FlgL
MKVKASINRLTGAQNNIRNAIGFLEVQDGLLETAGRIVMRMSELKGYATQDPLKSDSDVASYNNEFKDLQVQLYQISQMDFNGASLFASHRTDPDNPGETDNNNEAIFGAHQQDPLWDNTFDIYTSSEGSEGTKVSINKSMLLSALTMKQDGTIAGRTSDGDPNTTVASNAANFSNTTNAIEIQSAGTWKGAQEANTRGATDTGGAPAPNNNNYYITLAVESTEYALDLSQVSSGVFETAIENVVFLRAQTGGGMTRLNFALDSIASQETNMRSALGRIEDVDIAAESANLARYSILMQASAAMAVQANIQNEVALMLLR